MIIPIGIQCLNATLKKRIGKNDPTLPFDWMLSNPKFIYEILILLLDTNMDIKNIVEKHFFYCDKKANYSEIEHYYTDINGFALYNSKYDVIFPHDIYNDETIYKYIRRLERLKDLILNSKDKLIFIYSSQSSVDKGNFTIDKRIIVSDVYIYLSKIYNLINKYNNNNKMIVFDSIFNEEIENLDKNIILYKMESCNSWDELLNKILKKDDTIFN